MQITIYYRCALDFLQPIPTAATDSSPRSLAAKFRKYHHPSSIKSTSIQLPGATVNEVFVLKDLFYLTPLFQLFNHHAHALQEFA